MKKEAKETPDWEIILDICISAVLLAIIVTFWVKKSISNYNYCIDNIPSANWFEEDLEGPFLTTGVYVLDIDNEGDGLVVVQIYIEEPNGWGRYYRCLYRLKSFDSLNWHWELVRYI